MPKIVATSTSFSQHPVLQAEIRALFPEARLNEQGRKLRGDELLAHIEGAEGLVVGLEPITEALLAANPQLQIVSKYGVGLNNVDLAACERRGVAIGWTGGVNKRSVSEMALGYMLMLNRNLYQTSNLLKAGTWLKRGGRLLTGKTVGIIGLGHTGKDLVRLLQPFGCRILVNDIIEQSDYYAANGLEEVDKPTLFREADIVSIHTPYDDSTAHLVDLEVLKSMQPHAFLLNTARGGIIDEYALKTALRKGYIAGAAVDAYLEEPPTDVELLRLPNLICTPHIGGNAEEAVLAMGRSAIGHLCEFYGLA